MTVLLAVRGELKISTGDLHYQDNVVSVKMYTFIHSFGGSTCKICGSHVTAVR